MIAKVKEPLLLQLILQEGYTNTSLLNQMVQLAKRVPLMYLLCRQGFIVYMLFIHLLMLQELLLTSYLKRISAQA